jgi:hypothetical protein
LIKEDFMLLKKRPGDRENRSRGFGLVVITVAVLTAALAFSGCSKDEPLKIPSPPDTWTAVTGAPFEDTTIQKVTFGDNTFVATGNGGSAWYSADGVSWTAASDKIALGTNNLSGLTFGNGKFLTTGGSSGNTVRAYSDDQGGTWKESGTGFNC